MVIVGEGTNLSNTGILLINKLYYVAADFFYCYLHYTYLL